MEQAPVIDFVARNEFDFTIKDVADDKPWSSIDGLSYRNADGVIVHNPDRAILHDMDSLPFVTPVYKRDLKIENYFIGYLKHPYISIYTGRGCKSRCTFCLWPQTVGGHRYRTRSVEHVIEEIKYAKAAFPQVKEFFFDDDTFTDDLPRAEAIAEELGKLGVTWSLQRQGQRALREPQEAQGRRPAPAAGRLRERQPADPAQHQEGHARRGGREVHPRLPRARHRHPRHLHRRPAGRDPGDHPARPREWAAKINPHTIQVSLAAPYPGTFLYKQAVENGWLDADHAELVDEHGVQIAPLHYPHLQPPGDLRAASRPSTAASISARARSARSSSEMVRARR